MSVLPHTEHRSPSPQGGFAKHRLSHSPHRGSAPACLPQTAQAFPPATKDRAERMAYTALSFNAKTKRFTLYISRTLCIFTRFFLIIRTKPVCHPAFRDSLTLCVLASLRSPSHSRRAYVILRFFRRTCLKTREKRPLHR